jgi:hypothetical protein
MDMLDVVHLGIVERSVIDKNFDGIGAPIGNALRRNVGQQVGQASRLCIVVTAGLVREKQAGVFRARFGGGQAPFGIQQNGAGMGRQHLADRDFEFDHHFIGDPFLIDSFSGSKRFLQASALIHGGSSNHTGFIGERLHAQRFSF